MSARTLALRSTCVLCMLAATSIVGAAPGGDFDSGKTKIEIAGEYAFWDKSAGTSDSPNIIVAVSNGEFADEMFDPWNDRRHTINTFFVDDDTKVVFFEFDGNGRYKGYSFYFGSGDGCGYCYDSQVRSTVAPVGNRLKGKISHKAADSRRSFDIEIDVPIPDKSKGTALPRDGGDPGRAYLAYHQALRARDKTALLALMDARNRRHWEEHAKAKDLDRWIDFKHDRVHAGMNKVSLAGGYMKYDHAVLLFTGSSTSIDRLYGEAVLRREGGKWLFEDEWTDAGERP